MPGNLQHKFLQFEIPPPGEVWEKIADRLDEEYEAGNVILSKKMQEYEITPPAFIFDNILASLAPEQISKRPARIFTLPLKPIAVAAITIGLIATTIIYFLNSESSGTKNSTANIIPSIPGTNSGTSPETDKKGSEPDIRSEIEAGSLSGTSIKKTTQSNSRRGVKHVSLNPVLAANQISPISVTAPPIYDGDGNIIMDETLVSAPDDNYIIVTSPNGEQTKISRKFLKMLCVMNGGSDNNFMNAENFEWKLRFEEWRSKLLQQASYIPTANNFLDIMDLKELLQDN